MLKSLIAFIFCAIGFTGIAAFTAWYQGPLINEAIVMKEHFIMFMILMAVGCLVMSRFAYQEYALAKPSVE